MKYAICICVTSSYMQLYLVASQQLYYNIVIQKFHSTQSQIIQTAAYINSKFKGSFTTLLIDTPRGCNLASVLHKYVINVISESQLYNVTTSVHALDFNFIKHHKFWLIDFQVATTSCIKKGIKTATAMSNCLSTKQLHVIKLKSFSKSINRKLNLKLCMYSWLAGQNYILKE